MIGRGGGEILVRGLRGGQNFSARGKRGGRNSSARDFQKQGNPPHPEIMTAPLTDIIQMARGLKVVAHMETV